MKLPNYAFKFIHLSLLLLFLMYSKILFFMINIIAHNELVLTLNNLQAASKLNWNSYSYNFRWGKFMTNFSTILSLDTFSCEIRGIDLKRIVWFGMIWCTNFNRFHGHNDVGNCLILQFYKSLIPYDELSIGMGCSKI